MHERMPALQAAITGQVGCMKEAWAATEIQDALQCSLLLLRAGNTFTWDRRGLGV